MTPYQASYLFYDFGLFLSMAEKLARDLGAEVGYFCPWETSFADGRELLIGQGVPGIKRERYIEDALQRYDVLVCPDVQDNHYQAEQRQKGIPVWGAGLGGELELLRWKTKERFKAAGFKMNEAHKISGPTALRQFFKDNPRKEGWYVKISGLRGLGETWCAHDYLEAKGPIDEFEAKYTIQAAFTDFIVELAIPDATENGYDGLSIDGQFPDQSHWGIEKKDKAYFGRLCSYADLPEPVKRVNEVLSPIMRRYQYRGFFSSELRNDVPIDLTARHASPAGEPLVENILNLPDVIFFGARGELVQPKYEYRCAAQLILCSEFAETQPIYLRFPDKLRPHIKLYNHCRADIEGLGLTDCFIPQIAPQKQVGSVVALADDPEEAIELCKKRCEQVHAFDLDTYPESLDEAFEEVEEVLSAPA